MFEFKVIFLVNYEICVFLVMVQFNGVNFEIEYNEKMRNLFCFKFICVNRKFLVFKVFYFCYWGVVGLFFLFLGVYFKQLGMNLSLSGILVGCCLMVEFFSVLFLGFLVDCLNKWKFLMIFLLMCWIFFNFLLVFIKLVFVMCRKYFIFIENVL